jgi:nitrile hydratase accessory protein
MADRAEIDADLEGPVSPPRDNGEIVFAAPWERRLFGVTVALCRSATFGWETFRQQLIRRIAEDETRSYWRSWAVALEDVLAGSSLVTAAELDARELQMRNRPAGHDH